MPCRPPQTTNAQLAPCHKPPSSIVFAHWLMRGRTLEAAVARTPAPVVSTVWALMAFAIVIAQGSGNAFIYFQF